MTPTGKELYEADLKRRPRYPDGGPRKQWHQLSEVEQWSWNRPIGRDDRRAQSLLKDLQP